MMRACLWHVMLLLPLSVLSVSGCATFRTTTPSASTVTTDAAEEDAVTDTDHELERSDLQGVPGIGAGSPVEGSRHPTSTYRIDPSLSSSGITTKQAQLKLLSLGYHEVGIADGIMGARTREALRNFQQDRGIPVTGKIDPATRDELMKD